MSCGQLEVVTGDRCKWLPIPMPQSSAAHMRHIKELLKRMRWALRAVPRWLGHRCCAPAVPRRERYRILVIGVCIKEKKNYLRHLQREFSSSSDHEVRQKWIIIDREAGGAIVDTPQLYELYTAQAQPRMTFLNALLRDEDLSRFDHLIISDDDIKLPHRFVDAYMVTNSALGFSISQPARTLNSYISHKITRRVKGLIGRQTHFVEIGPLVCISKSLFAHILPFDSATPSSGFGLDVIWPQVVFDLGLTMGIIDSVTVDHSLRPTGVTYDFGRAISDMAEYLSTRRQLSQDMMERVVKEYPVSDWPIWRP